MAKREDKRDIILSAAKMVFYEMGFNGAKMQDIADRAEINRAMLHYYYADKETLFNDVFKSAVKDFFSKMKPLFDNSLPILEKIKQFIHHYIDLFIDDELLPGFLLKELSFNKEWLLNTLIGLQHQINQFKLCVEEGIQDNILRPINSNQLFLDLISLCAHPFVAKSMFQSALQLSDEEYKQLLLERKDSLTELFINSLKL